MTEELNAGIGLTEAVIYLKNGKRKYGMLIVEAVNESYRFISGNNYSLFMKDQNPEHVEKLHCSEIDTIDTNLK